jgi:hypothetical protein
VEFGVAARRYERLGEVVQAIGRGLGRIAPGRDATPGPVDPRQM